MPTEPRPIRLLLESSFQLWIDHRDQNKRHDLWNDEALKRIEGLARVIGVNHDSAACSAERIGGILVDTNLESALDEQFRFVPLFFSLARSLREHPRDKRLENVRDLAVLTDLVNEPEGLLEAALFLNQARAAKIALALEEALPFDWAFAEELECVIRSRRLRSVEPASVEGDVLEDRVKDAQLLGLAFSGGGIRSATLNLGLLQALAELDLLRYMDYLSTVSGGGFVGSWLHGWIRQEQGLRTVRAALSPKESPDPESIATHPIKWLRQYSNYLSPRLGLFSVDTWTIASVWMRNTLLNLLVLIPFLCGLLLLPRMFTGLPDFPAAGYCTAMLGLILAGYFAQFNLESAPKTGGDAERQANRLDAANKPDPPPAKKSGLAGFIQSQPGIQLGVCGPLFLSALGMAAWLGHGTATSGVGRIKDRLQQLPALTSWFSGFLHAVGIRSSDLFVGGVVFVVLSALLIILSLKYCSATGSAGRKFLARVIVILFGCLLPGAVGAVHLVVSAHVFAVLDPFARPWHLAALGVPAIILVYSLVIILHLGLLGRNLTDEHREWWSRLGALLTIYMFGWCGLFGAAIYGPLFLAWLVNLTYGWYAASGLGAGWVATTIAGALTARSSSTGGNKSGSLADILAKVAPAVFVAGLALLLSLGIHLLILQFPSRNWGPQAVTLPTGQRAEFQVSGEGGRRLDISYNGGSKQAATQPVTLDCRNGCGLPSPLHLQAFHFQLLSVWCPVKACQPGTLCESLCPRGALWSLLAALLCGLIAFGVACRVDVNEFSLYHFYRNRLVRCYLGASRRKRRANFFTGFDPDDDFPIPSLLSGEGRYAGPYPIVNTALNLVKGDELAWQERKAESFFFTPLFSGFAAMPTEEVRPAAQSGRERRKLSLHAYRRTTEYAFRPHGVRMGTAVAISGAAASPNMGYHTSASAAFLMTVFNVRLGWWIGNPRHGAGWRRPGPLIGLLQLLCELTASTDNKSKYLYLSDGGHFENLGIYELVRRRCQYIIASDGGYDPAFSFEDLGNAIRKCRADFGVEIEIDGGDIRPKAGEPRSAAHCAVGAIKYPEGAWGTLVYIKSSLTGDEPTDVLEYAAQHPEFPHQPTSDQFFDESQFESYRKLGYHTGMSVLREIVLRRIAALERDGLDPREKGPIGSDRDRFFSDLREFWYASSPNVLRSFTRHAEALTLLMKQLREDPDLAFMDEQISPEWSRLMRHGMPPLSSGLDLPVTYQERRAGFHFCNSLMQLMEDVYLDLDLEGESTHPDNAGWINLFKHWSWSSMFRVTWAISAGCYGSRFRNFCLYRLGLGVDALGEITVDEADGFDDSRLNYRERELLSARADLPGDANIALPPGEEPERPLLVTSEKNRLFLLQVSVNAPDRPKTVLVQLTFGLAVADLDGNLVYLRVQDHLRRMGLARRAVEAMVRLSKDGADVFKGIQWKEFPKDFPERVEEENKDRVERMWHAAWLSRPGRGAPPDR